MWEVGRTMVDSAKATMAQHVEVAIPTGIENVLKRPLHGNPSFCSIGGAPSTIRNAGFRKSWTMAQVLIGGRGI